MGAGYGRKGKHMRHKASRFAAEHHFISLKVCADPREAGMMS